MTFSLELSFITSLDGPAEVKTPSAGQLGGSVVTVTIGAMERVAYIAVTWYLQQNAPNQADLVGNQTCFMCQVDPAVLVTA